MKTWFTSDLHLGCEGLVKATRPEFSSVEEHDDALIDNINRMVDRDDRLVILGDFCFKKPGKYRPRIRCRNIFFILGNHDNEHKTRAVFGGNVWTAKMVKLKGGHVWCSHYPHCYWDRSHYGTYHAYGHLHYNIGHEHDMYCAFPQRRSMDVGVDAAIAILGEYRPFLEDEFFDVLWDAKGHGLCERK